MSIQVRAAKAATGPSLPGYGSVRAIPRGMPMGDPGFFGDLWGGIKGAVGGALSGNPLNIIGGAIGGFTGASQTSPTQSPTLPPMITMGPTLPFVPQQNGRNGSPPTVRERVERILPGGRTGYESQTEEQMRAGKPSRTGYHWNKSGHFLKSGTYIYPGTIEVKNRKMNPLNPSAVRSSMKRLGRAKTAAKDINRVTIRKKACSHK